MTTATATATAIAPDLSAIPPPAAERQMFSVPVIGVSALVSNRYALLTDLEHAAIREPAGIVTRSREATDTAQIRDSAGRLGVPVTFLAQPLREAIRSLPLANAIDTDARADAFAFLVPDARADGNLALVHVEALDPVEIVPNDAQRRMLLRWPLMVPAFRRWRATLTISAAPDVRIDQVIRALNAVGQAAADPDGNAIRFRVDPGYRHAQITVPLGANLDAAAQRRQPSPDDLPLTVGRLRAVLRELLAEYGMRQT